ncbi:MAG: tRNA (adenosine(37)-N6)-dimethylallyltransferase MiaA [Flavobacteriales bacterium]|nr:tRNA (adenosine(37)-N6)-dimethylallyltransferase MiaA [Flavobacteriales bacterium]
MNDLIVILGPTAVGKTKLAVALANQLNAELISADSRQVYKEMNLGTGKDLDDFWIGGRQIQHHLIDIKEAGEEYHVFDFQQDFYRAFEAVLNKDKTPILCGGTGLYLEAALAKEKMIEVPENETLRAALSLLSQNKLNEKLKRLCPKLHNTTDIEDRVRTLRAIEIELFKQSNKAEKSPVKNPCIFGIEMERQALRARIEERMKERLENGMIEEVDNLMKKGITAEKLHYYGLEYRFITAYLMNEISYNELYDNLVQAIRRFAKKQMTWYRRMEKRGHLIHWLNATTPLEQKIIEVNDTLSKLNER